MKTMLAGLVLAFGLAGPVLAADMQGAPEKGMDQPAAQSGTSSDAVAPMAPMMTKPHHRMESSKAVQNQHTPGDDMAEKLNQQELDRVTKDANP